jgi:hypothetical protein
MAVYRLGQIVVRKSDCPGAEHGQTRHFLPGRECGLHFSSNGSDIWLRRWGDRPPLQWSVQSYLNIPFKKKPAPVDTTPPRPVDWAVLDV